MLVSNILTLSISAAPRTFALASATSFMSLLHFKVPSKFVTMVPNAVQAMLMGLGTGIIVIQEIRSKHRVGGNVYLVSISVTSD